MSHRQHEVHQHHKRIRSQRLSEGVYGVVHKPTLPSNVIGIWIPPSYAHSHMLAQQPTAKHHDGVDRHWDSRCFYSGVNITAAPSVPPRGWNTDARKMPWLGTRDHLVPRRRHVHSEVQTQNYTSSLVWCSNVVNVTLGMAPLLVRLKIRQWLMTTPYDRHDVSVAAGLNMRWLIIHYLDWFRIEGRYPWSRRERGDWWNPEVQQLFMQRMWHKEREFLTLSQADRDAYVHNFRWQF
jgi:hypothetical protein